MAGKMLRNRKHQLGGLARSVGAKAGAFLHHAFDLRMERVHRCEQRGFAVGSRGVQPGLKRIGTRARQFFILVLAQMRQFILERLDLDDQRDRIVVLDGAIDLARGEDAVETERPGAE